MEDLCKYTIYISSQPMPSAKEAIINLTLLCLDIRVDT